MHRCNGAARQRRAWEAVGDLRAVYAHAIAELQDGHPIWLEEQARPPEDRPRAELTPADDFYLRAPGIGVWWI